jgi:glutaminyl-tRNA synthetase
LFNVEDPTDSEADFKSFLNPDSLQVVAKAYAEPALSDASLGDRFQFLRQGYFVLDKDSSTDKLIFNKTVGLKDAWAKEAKKG